MEKDNTLLALTGSYFSFPTSRRGSQTNWRVSGEVTETSRELEMVTGSLVWGRKCNCLGKKSPGQGRGKGILWKWKGSCSAVSKGKCVTNQSCKPWAGTLVWLTRWGMLQTTFFTGTEVGGSSASAECMTASTNYPRVQTIIIIGMHRNAERCRREKQCLNWEEESPRKHTLSKHGLTEKMGKEIKKRTRCNCQKLYCGRKHYPR